MLVTLWCAAATAECALGVFLSTERRRRTTDKPEVPTKATRGECEKSLVWRESLSVTRAARSTCGEKQDLDECGRSTARDPSEAPEGHEGRTCGGAGYTATSTQRLIL